MEDLPLFYFNHDLGKVMKVRKSLGQSGIGVVSQVKEEIGCNDHWLIAGKLKRSLLLCKLIDCGLGLLSFF